MERFACRLFVCYVVLAGCLSDFIGGFLVYFHEFLDIMSKQLSIRGFQLNFRVKMVGI